MSSPRIPVKSHCPGERPVKWAGSHGGGGDPAPGLAPEATWGAPHPASPPMLGAEVWVAEGQVPLVKGYGEGAGAYLLFLVWTHSNVKLKSVAILYIS